MFFWTAYFPSQSTLTRATTTWRRPRSRTSSFRRRRQRRRRSPETTSPLLRTCRRGNPLWLPANWLADTCCCSSLHTPTSCLFLHLSLILHSCPHPLLFPVLWKYTECSKVADVTELYCHTVRWVGSWLQRGWSSQRSSDIFNVS